MMQEYHEIGLASPVHCSGRAGHLLNLNRSLPLIFITIV